jgi:hypothetical protein
LPFIDTRFRHGVDRALAPCKLTKPHSKNADPVSRIGADVCFDDFADLKIGARRMAGPVSVGS